MPSAAGPWTSRGSPNLREDIILFQVDGAAAADLPGADPTPCSQGGGAGSSSRFVAGWAPGGGNTMMPAVAGFPPDGASKYMVQVHLNNQQGLVGEVDGSGMDMCVGAPRQYDADVMATGSVGFKLPPRADTTSTCETTWRKDDVHIFASSPHMHRLVAD